MPKAYDAFRFIGGLDLNTPYLERSPGTLLNVLNYEPDPDGGYRRIPGYERYDGQPSPTDVSIIVIQVDALIDPAPTLGDVLTGSDSGATGTYLDQSSDPFLVFVANVSGTFTEDDTISGVNVTADSSNAIFIASDETVSELETVARDYNRSQILEVPGSGPVRAAYEHEGVVYAIRDNDDATAANIYRDTPTGWELVDFTATRFLNFDEGVGGSADPFAIGNEVTGETSNATGTVTAIGIQANDRQAGYIVIGNATGTFQDNENIQVSETTVAVVNGAPQTPSLNAGGSYEIVSWNFFGGTATFNMYITNGQQTALQFDGTTIAPIFTGIEAVNDTPIHVTIHADHLFLGYDGGTLLHSVVGEPLNFRGDLGAFEFALGSDITNVITSPQSLVVTTTNNSQVIFGSGVDNWEKTFITTEKVGAANSGQYLARPLVLDLAGVIALDRVDSFGNFQDALISDNVRSLANANFSSVVTSVVNRFSNHYIIFTSTGFNLLVGFANNEFIGYFPINLNRIVMYASANERRMFFGTQDTGYVYEWLKGTSFDGGNIESLLQTTYAFQGQPQSKKRYRRVTISLGSFNPRLPLSFAFSFNKGAANTRSSTFDGSALSGGGRWDFNNWNEFLWDGQDVPEIISDIDGVGTDISMALYNNSADLDSFIVEDIVIEYSPRALKR